MPQGISRALSARVPLLSSLTLSGQGGTINIGGLTYSVEPVSGELNIICAGNDCDIRGLQLRIHLSVAHAKAEVSRLDYALQTWGDERTFDRLSSNFNELLRSIRELLTADRSIQAAITSVRNILEMGYVVDYYYSSRVEIEPTNVKANSGRYAASGRIYLPDYFEYKGFVKVQAYHIFSYNDLPHAFGFDVRLVVGGKGSGARTAFAKLANLMKSYFEQKFGAGNLMFTAYQSSKEAQVSVLGDVDPGSFYTALAGLLGEVKKVVDECTKTSTGSATRLSVEA